MRDCGGSAKFCNSHDFASTAAAADGRQPDGLNDGGRSAYRFCPIARHIADVLRLCDLSGERLGTVVCDHEPLGIHGTTAFVNSAS